MSVLSGCQDGKTTPKLMEVACPQCSGVLEIFVRMGGSATETGRLAADAVCDQCGYSAQAGMDAAQFKEV